MCYPSLNDLPARHKLNILARIHWEVYRLVSWSWSIRDWRVLTKDSGLSKPHPLLWIYQVGKRSKLHGDPASPSHSSSDILVQYTRIQYSQVPPLALIPVLSGPFLLGFLSTDYQLPTLSSSSAQARCCATKTQGKSDQPLPLWASHPIGRLLQGGAGLVMNIQRVEQEHPGGVWEGNMNTWHLNFSMSR